MSELKPCPFCGKDPIEFESLHNNPQQMVFCPCLSQFAEEVSASDWNTRPIEDALRAENTALHAALRRRVIPIGGNLYECKECNSYWLPSEPEVHDLDCLARPR